MSALREVLEFIAGRFGVGVAVGFGVFLLFYLTQDRAARLGGWLTVLLNRGLTRVRRLTTWFRRKRLERRFRSLLAVHRHSPFVTGRVKLTWTDGLTSAESFFENERFVVRMPTVKNPDEVLVDSVFLYVSKALLPTQKKHLSNSQRQAIDLYVSGRLLERASITLEANFIDRFQTDFAANDLAYQYIREFQRLERYGLFDHVFLRELDFLGQKALPPGGSQAVSRDIDALLQLLARLSRRDIGEDIPLTLERRYVRVGVVIVGKHFKITDGPAWWTRYIINELSSRLIDSVYVLANHVNKALVEEIAEAISDVYEVVRRDNAHVLLAGTPIDRYSIEFRSHGASMYTPDLDTELMALLSERTSIDDVVAGNSDGRMLGTVRDVATQEEAGSIQLDDPALDVDVQFSLDDVTDASAALAPGTKVSLLVAEKHGTYTARAVRIVLPPDVGARGLPVDRASGAVLAPADDDKPQTTATRLAHPPIDEADVRVFVRQLLASTQSALPLARVANELIAEFGDEIRVRGWLGYGGCKMLLRALDIGAHTCANSRMAPRPRTPSTTANEWPFQRQRADTTRHHQPRRVGNGSPATHSEPGANPLPRHRRSSLGF